MSPTTRCWGYLSQVDTPYARITRRAKAIGEFQLEVSQIIGPPDEIRAPAVAVPYEQPALHRPGSLLLRWYDPPAVEALAVKNRTEAVTIGRARCGYRNAQINRYYNGPSLQ